MDFLDLTSDEAQTRINNLSAGPPVHKITVGAAILRNSLQGDTQILLLKRSAHEKYYPNVFEMPGGKVDANETLRPALIREVNEESGLVVSRIIEPLTTFNYTTTKTGEGSKKATHRYTQQFSYIAAIDGDGSDFRVRLAEHSEGSWFSASDLASISMTDEMRNLVIQALSETRKGAGHATSF